MKGCLAVICAFVLLMILLAACLNDDEGSGDCYTTGSPGSAQAERDIEHCIKQDR